MGPHEQEPELIACIACGEWLSRAEAREYDRFGDRWDRNDKAFEYLCKPCHALESHQPRGSLEHILERVGSDHASPEAFIDAYYRQVAEEESEELDT